MRDSRSICPTSRSSKPKSDNFGYEGYLSPFTWRYGSKEMRVLFSEVSKRARWRKVWLALAEAEHDMDLVSARELDDIRLASGREMVDVPAALAVEAEVQHDLMSELTVFAREAKRGGGKIHLGATSADIEDNADALLHLKALDLILERLASCMAALRGVIMRYRGTACMGWTHLQPAEPTTLGYRFANYAQDLLLDLAFAEAVRGEFLMAKGVKGAVGTSASFSSLAGSSVRSRKLEGSVMMKLGLKPFEVATQTYPRKVDFLLIASLASIAQSCHKFGLDLRVMQSPAFGEWSEPFGERQVGSSAMPFKRNPVQAERMCSLARIPPSFLGVGFSNAANAILERTLDDSASRRIALPEAFLAVDECLRIYERIVVGLKVYPAMIKKNLERYGSFSGTEPLLMALVKRGADRQKMHELIRAKSSLAWAQVMEGRPNPLERILVADRKVSDTIGRRELHLLLDPSSYVGDARDRCGRLVREQLDPAMARIRKRGVYH